MNCLSCKYCDKSHQTDDVICDINKLFDGRESRIEKDKLEIDCPCHSDIHVIELRYFHDDEEIHTCQYCNRIVKNESDLQAKRKKIGKINKRLKVCSICVNKYFD